MWQIGQDFCEQLTQHFSFFTRQALQSLLQRIEALRHQRFSGLRAFSRQVQGDSAAIPGLAAFDQTVPLQPINQAHGARV